MKIRRALISVSDKPVLLRLRARSSGKAWTIISTGGTARNC
jgi:AICAR transformylase/IMP cyclohydrolase PurH